MIDQMNILVRLSPLKERQLYEPKDIEIMMRLWKESFLKVSMLIGKCVWTNCFLLLTPLILKKSNWRVMGSTKDRSRISLKGVWKLESLFLRARARGLES